MQGILRTNSNLDPHGICDRMISTGIRWDFRCSMWSDNADGKNVNPSVYFPLRSCPFLFRPMRSLSDKVRGKFWGCSKLETDITGLWSPLSVCYMHVCVITHFNRNLQVSYPALVQFAFVNVRCTWVTAGLLLDMQRVDRRCNWHQTHVYG